MKRQTQMNDYDYEIIKLHDGVKESYMWVRCKEKDVEDIFIGVLKIIKKIKENVER